ncbi:hypothetical protein [Polaribacter sp.]|uniref:hypothetical protein n=1 Tax=Polaribacter sp. TaxID=1920175 RepID=UPI003F6B5D2C
MDVLENYKKIWGNQPEETRKLSTVDIYKLAHSKSSSIVKWIFIIGILEFLFWSALNFIIPDSFYQVYEELNLTNFMNIFLVLHYVVITIFLYLFYNNHQRVSITDNTKKLMRNILRIRKTVKYYVFYNLATVFLTSLILNIVMFSDSEKLMEFMNPENLPLDSSQIIIITIVSQIIFLLIALVLLWLFYKIVYGILLKKLNRNYKELAKLDALS